MIKLYCKKTKRDHAYFEKKFYAELWENICPVLIRDLERIIVRADLCSVRPQDLMQLRQGLSLVPTLDQKLIFLSASKLLQRN